MLNAMVGGVLRDLAADGGGGGRCYAGSFAAGEEAYTGFKPRIVVASFNTLKILLFASPASVECIRINLGTGFAAVDTRVTFTDNGFTVSLNDAGVYIAFE